MITLIWVLLSALVGFAFQAAWWILRKLFAFAGWCVTKGINYYNDRKLA